MQNITHMKNGREITLSLRIDWSEMDLFCHVNNVSFFKYIQAARVHFWETIGLTQGPDEHSIGPMLANASCQYLHPLFYPGNIEIIARVHVIKNTSFGFFYHIYDDKKNLAAKASDVMVMFHFEKNHKVQIPDWLREKLQPYLEQP